jgi:hypothetical protein
MTSAPADPVSATADRIEVAGVLSLPPLVVLYQGSDLHPALLRIHRLELSLEVVVRPNLIPGLGLDHGPGNQGWMARRTMLVGLWIGYQDYCCGGMKRWTLGKKDVRLEGKKVNGSKPSLDHQESIHTSYPLYAYEGVKEVPCRGREYIAMWKLGSRPRMVKSSFGHIHLYPHLRPCWTEPFR